MLGSNLLPFGTGLPNPLAQARSCSAAPNVLPGFGLTTGAADPSTPQSLNAYGYAAQSPATFINPHGTDFVDPDCVFGCEIICNVLLDAETDGFGLFLCIVGCRYACAHVE